MEVYFLLAFILELTFANVILQMQDRSHWQPWRVFMALCVPAQLVPALPLVQDTHTSSGRAVTVTLAPGPGPAL